MKLNINKIMNTRINRNTDFALTAVSDWSLNGDLPAIESKVAGKRMYMGTSIFSMERSLIEAFKHTTDPESLDYYYNNFFLIYRVSRDLSTVLLIEIIVFDEHGIYIY